VQDGFYRQRQGSRLSAEVDGRLDLVEPRSVPAKTPEGRQESCRALSARGWRNSAFSGDREALKPHTPARPSVPRPVSLGGGGDGLLSIPGIQQHPGCAAVRVQAHAHLTRDFIPDHRTRI
jgi:hypothetical protein